MSAVISYEAQPDESRRLDGGDLHFIDFSKVAFGGETMDPKSGAITQRYVVIDTDPRFPVDISVRRTPVKGGYDISVQLSTWQHVSYDSGATMEHYPATFRIGYRVGVLAQDQTTTMKMLEALFTSLYPYGGTGTPPNLDNLKRISAGAQVPNWSH